MILKDVLDFPPLAFDTSSTSVDGVGVTLTNAHDVSVGVQDTTISIISSEQASDDFGFVLAPPTEEIVTMPSGKIETPSHLRQSFNHRTYEEKGLPTIDPKFFESSGDDDGGNMGISDSNNPSPTQDKGVSNIVVPPNSPIPQVKVYSSLEMGKAKPYLIKIQQLLAGIDTTDRDHEISGLARLLYYMMRYTDTFFNYEQKWHDNKDRYIAKAKEVNGTFLEKILFLLQMNIFADASSRNEKIVKAAHSIFLEQKQKIKETVMKKFLDEMTDEDRADVSGYVDGNDDTKPHIPSFQLKNIEEFEFLFDFYFRRWKDLKHKKQQQAIESVAEKLKRRCDASQDDYYITPRVDNLGSKISGIEAEFDAYFAQFLNEKGERKEREDVIAEQKRITSAKLDEKRQQRASGTNS